MTLPKLDLVAPGMTARNWNEAEVLGAGAWLCTHSSMHRDLPLQTISSQMLPAIEHRQFVLGSRAGEPLFYMSWAKFTANAEARYLDGGTTTMATRDWDSGQRLWIIDWVAPFGHTATLARIVRQQLFRHWTGRMVYHRAQPPSSRIKTFRGSAMTPADARQWHQSNPVGLPRDSQSR